MDTEADQSASPFRDYSPPTSVFDELRNRGNEIRQHWRAFKTAFEQEDAAELRRKLGHANDLIRDNGLTYNAFKDSHGGERPWKIDLLPFILADDQWKLLAQGIEQRAALLAFVLDDIYGPQNLLNDGDLPPDVIFGHSGYHRPFCNLPIAQEHRLTFFGCEAARSPDGRWWAMADRTESPAGAGYALENRIVISRTWPNLMHDCHVRRLAPFFLQLRQACARLAPRATENPRIVLLTAGAGDASYFEDVYLARYLGITLVEGGDLAVRDDCVFIKTLDGLVQIDVIFSRVGETEIDPLELRTTSPRGATGILQAIRKNNVAMVNAPGCGLVESPVFMAFLPRLCRKFMGCELKLPSIATWWCGDATSRKYVFEHLSELVIKPAFEVSGSEEIFGNSLSKDETAALIARIREQPTQYVAQEIINRSATPVWSSEGMQTGYAAIRTFAVKNAKGYETMPGALVRVAAEPGPMELSIKAGDGSKDAWIIADGPVEPVTLLTSADQNPELRRNSPQLPSRVADNLFWLGRHLDRAEISARLLRVIVDRLSGEREPGEIPELSALIRVLAAAGQIEPDYAIDGLDKRMPDLEEHLPKAIFDTGETRSLRSTVSEIHRLGSTIRDRLSHDTWRAVSRINEHFYPSPSAGVIPLDEALTLLNQLIIDLAVFDGLTNQGMVRGPAWRFLDIGRRLERAQLTSKLLLELIDQGRNPSLSVLDAVLDVMDLQMTYRARYLAAIRIGPIFDLLIADASNPRSLIFQMIELQHHIDALPGNKREIGLSDEQKIVSDSLHQLQMLNIGQQLQVIADDNKNYGSAAHESTVTVRALLKKMARAMKELSGLLSRKYLVHSGAPRRIQDDPLLPP